MRLFTSAFWLISIGISTSLANGQNVASMPLLNGGGNGPAFSALLSESTGTHPLKATTEIAKTSYQTPAYRPPATKSGSYGDVFDNALSQFEGTRTARLPKADRDAPLIIETSPVTESLPAGTADSINSLSADLPPADLGSIEDLSPTSAPPKSPWSSGGDFAQPVKEAPPVAKKPAEFEPIERTPESITNGAALKEKSPDELPYQWEAPETEDVSTEADKRSIFPENDVFEKTDSDFDSDREPDLDVPPASTAGWSEPFESLLWWKDVVNQPIDGSRSLASVDSNSLVYLALQNSPRIQAVSQTPLIRELQIVEADSEFDAVRYVRSQFEDRVDPVGNQLTVGNGESFLKDNIWSADAGFTKKARNGAVWELNQRLGFQNSNSNFFDPQDQGTATLSLNVTQPLLRGRGKYYNQSQILIAQASNGAAWQTFQAELQDELMGVVSAYWDLYLNRSVYLQKRRNVERGEKILARLEGRRRLDSLPSQIARARSSVQTRRTELANAVRDVLNSETEVRRRIADKSWMSGSSAELIPSELPSLQTFNIPLEEVVYQALQHRPEIQQAISQARLAAVQQNVSAHELLPELSLLVGTYVSALRADTGILNAFQDQFGQVKPGYSFGINFELPVGNRAARSRLAQRQVQARLIRAQLEEVLQNVVAESQVALRRVASASETLVAATEAITAARADREQFQRRWESFALVEGDLADGQNPTTVLDQLLDSQDRLASVETIYVEAERELKVAEIALQRAMGTLLISENISTARGFEEDVPLVELFKN